MNKQQIILRCYAEGFEGNWEAICLDFDLAVQGRSFNEVSELLKEAVDGYLDTVSDLPSDERVQFLARRAPWSLRLKFACRYVAAFLFGRPSDNKERHNYTAQAACGA